MSDEHNEGKEGKHASQDGQDHEHYSSRVRVGQVGRKNYQAARVTFVASAGEGMGLPRWLSVSTSI